MAQIRHRKLGVTAEVPDSTVPVWRKFGWQVVRIKREIAEQPLAEQSVPVGDETTPSEED